MTGPVGPVKKTPADPFGGTVRERTGVLLWCSIVWVKCLSNQTPKPIVGLIRCLDGSECCRRLRSQR